MSTVIYYHCRAPQHLAAPSRFGIGGIVFRHGTAAYCDGVGVDAEHHWVPTGGVALETLFAAERDQTVWEGDSHGDAGARAGYVSHEGRQPGPSAAHA
jgi:hypothetical protein